MTTKAERRRLLKSLPDQKPPVSYTTAEDGSLVVEKTATTKAKHPK